MSTHTRLNLLAASVAVPIMGFAGVVLWQFSRSEQVRYEDEALTMSRQASAAVDRELTGLLAALEALATSPAVLDTDRAPFYAQAQTLLRTRGTFVSMRDRSGQQVMNSSVPFGTPLPKASDPVLLATDRVVFATGRPAISDLFTGTTTRLQLVAIDSPVVRDNEVVLAILLSLDPRRLADALTATMPRDWTATLIDRNGRILAGSQQHAGPVGSPAPATPAGVETGKAGVWLAAAGPDPARYVAQTKSEISGWRLLVSAPADLVGAPTNRLIRQLLAGGLVASFLSALIAARFAQSISKPMTTVAAAASRLGRGQKVPLIATGLREADEVGRRLRQAEEDIQQRQTALRASEARFRAAVRAVNGVIWTNDESGRMNGQQLAWQSLTGQSEAEYTGFGWAAAVHPDDAAPTVQAWHAAVRQRSTFVFEHRLRVLGGGYRLFAIRAIPVMNGDATIEEWVGVHTDITDEREAKAALAESQGRLRAVFDAAPVGLVIAEAPNGRIVDGNNQVEAIFRHPIIRSADVDAYRAWVGFHADGRPVEGYEYPLGRIFGGGEDRAELEVLYQRGDGTRAWVRIVGSAIRDPDGTLRGAVAAVLDIDPERRAAAELRRLNVTLEQRVSDATAERDRIWRLSRELMLVTRADKRQIVAVNPAWKTVLGWNVEDLLGRALQDFLDPNEHAEAAAESARLSAGLAAASFERKVLSRDGSYRWFAWTAVPEQGLVYAIGRDVTQEKAVAETLRHTEEQLRQSQKMEIVGQLTGGVAHDFNNLLTVVIGSLDLAHRRIENGQADERVLKNIANAMDGAQRAATLTSRLLAFSRQSPLRPAMVDLNACITGMSDLIRRTLGENIVIDTVLADDLRRAELDSSQVESAILNLCVNARDAMPQGGKLTIASANIELGEADPAVVQGAMGVGGAIMITVTDTGIGIAPELLGRVFEPFFTTKPVGKGTGLGLSQLYGFVRQSGGHVDLSSVVGQGTSIRLTFPPAPAAAMTEEPPRAGSDGCLARARGQTILVIEDEALVREITTAALEDAGYTVLSAEDGPTGLALLDGHPEIELLFTDIVLTGPINGRQVAAEALARRPGLRVLYTTGYSRNAIIHDGRLDDDVTLLPKPFRTGELLQAIGRMLESVPA